MPRGPSRAFLSYLAWQLPGWAVVGAVVAWLALTFDLPAHVAVLVVLLYVVKDLVLFPLLAATFVPPASHQHVGAIAEAVEPIAPVGYVRVGGELWQARTTGPDLPAGARVVVRGACGLTLVVDADLTSAADGRAPAT